MSVESMQEETEAWQEAEREAVEFANATDQKKFERFANYLFAIDFPEPRSEEAKQVLRAASIAIHGAAHMILKWAAP